MAILLPPVPKTLMVRLVGDQATSYRWNNILHLEYSTAWTPGVDISAVASAISVLWNTNVAPIIRGDTRLTQVVVVDLDSRTGPTGVDSTIRTGTQALTPALPSNVSMCISWIISRRYRGGHPRTYLPATLQSNLTGNNWLNTYVTSCTTAMGNFYAGLNAMTAMSQTYKMVMVSYYSGTDASGRPILKPTPSKDYITGVKIHNRVDTQRRRLGKEVA